MIPIPRHNFRRAKKGHYIIISRYSPHPPPSNRPRDRSPPHHILSHSGTFYPNDLTISPRPDLALPYPVIYICTCSLINRVENAAKAPQEAAPVLKIQAPDDAPATIAEVQKEVASTTTKVKPPSRHYCCDFYGGMFCCYGNTMIPGKLKWDRSRGVCG